MVGIIKFQSCIRKRWWRSSWATSPTSAPMRIFKPCSASMREEHLNCQIDCWHFHFPWWSMIIHDDPWRSMTIHVTPGTATSQSATSWQTSPMALSTWMTTRLFSPSASLCTPIVSILLIHPSKSNPLLPCNPFHLQKLYPTQLISIFGPERPASREEARWTCIQGKTSQSGTFQLVSTPKSRLHYIAIVLMLMLALEKANVTWCTDEAMLMLQCFPILKFLRLAPPSTMLSSGSPPRFSSAMCHTVQLVRTSGPFLNTLVLISMSATRSVEHIDNTVLTALLWQIPHEFLQRIYWWGDWFWSWRYCTQGGGEGLWFCSCGLQQGL